MAALAQLIPLILIFVIFVALPVAFFVHLYRQERARTQKALYDVASWPSTQGTIVSAEISQSIKLATLRYAERQVYPKVSYSYMVNGTTYRGTTLTPELRPNVGSVAVARKMLEQFPVGGQVVVYYDPANPSQAVLSKTPLRAPFVLNNPPMIMAAILLVLLVVAIVGIMSGAIR